MKFAVVFIVLVATVGVFAQMNLPFPFNAIQIPQIVPAPFCLCGVLPRLKINEKDECMKESFCHNYMQPIQEEICHQGTSSLTPPGLTPPGMTPPSFSPQFLLNTLAQFQQRNQPQPQQQHHHHAPQHACNICRRPTCTCNDYC